MKDYNEVGRRSRPKEKHRTRAHATIYLKTTVSSIAPKHCTILFCMSASTFSSKCRFGSCLPTFLMANCSGVIFSSSSRACPREKEKKPNGKMLCEY